MNRTSPIEKRRPVDKPDRTTAPLSFEEVLDNPDAFFSAPHEVVEYGAFEYDERRRILKAWEADARAKSVAVEENMGGDDEESMLGEIIDALKKIGDDAADGFTASKMGT